MNASTRLLLVAVVVVVMPTVTRAHFRLIQPASWLVESDLGDPQKAGPCGGTNADYGKPSGIINQAVGGSPLHLKVQETVYHPGHYRVALAVNSPTELPLDPKATTVNTDNGPHAHVRHPMYAGAIWLFVGMPLALGSWWSLGLLVPFVPVLLWRLLDEEKILQRDLPGYTEYMRRVRFRLVPSVW